VTELWPAAVEAAEMVESGMVVGLGTGRAATMFVRALAERMKTGLEIRGVPTSKATEELARELGIPLVSLDEINGVDIDVDGADEVSPVLDLIKGHGGALLRERIVASFSSRFVIIVGREKLVPELGTRVAVPVEVVPFGLPVARRELETMGGSVKLRGEGQRPYRTDNGNAILEVAFGSITSPEELDRRIDQVPGVVDNGLFIGMADLVLVQRDTGVERLDRENLKKKRKGANTPRRRANL
jgi:ribose 5-phosphate isomerase A